MALAAMLPSVMQAASIDVVTTLAPLNATTGSGVRGVHALTASQTWTANNEYFLTDRVFIPKGIVLVIEPGTKIFGITSDPNSTPTNKADDKVGALVAARGGMLIADGTAAKPIVFSSVADWEAQNNTDSPFDADVLVSSAPTKTSSGQWGGVVLLGNAYINHLNGTSGTVLGNATIEGFVPASSPSDDADSPALPDAIEYGFDSSNTRDDYDSSGVLRYVSIRHGGYEFEAAKEINGLTLGGVGAGTIIDYVEVYANQDDGIEFFGGTVSTKHLCLAYNQDDNFDFDSGHTGTHQFLFSIADPGMADGGWEADGIEGTTTTGAAYEAAFVGTTFTNASDKVLKTGVTLSKPIVYNATLIGAGRNNTFSTIAAGYGQVLTEKGHHGLIFDDFFNGELYNSVIDDFAQDVLFLRDSGNKSTGATAAIAYNTIGRFGSAVNPQVDTATAAGTIATSGNVTVTVTGALVTGSPLSVSVAALNTDTASVWAGKVRVALAALPAITTSYNVSGTDTSIVISTKVNASNDTTLNIALANGTTTGVTAAATSANTVLGNAAASVNSGGGSNNATYVNGANTPNLIYNASTGVALDGNSNPNTDPQYTTYTRNGSNVLTAINPIPASGSPLLSSSLQTGAPVTVTYRGAFGTTNWAAGWTKFSATGILQGAAEGSAPFADADSDGISDTLEDNAALTTLGFNKNVNNVSPTNLFSSIYTAASILDLRTTAGVTVQKVGNTATLTVPVQKSTGLNTWAPAGNMTLGVDVSASPTKEFYRLQVQDAN